MCFLEEGVSNFGDWFWGVCDKFGLDVPSVFGEIGLLLLGCFVLWYQGFGGKWVTVELREFGESEVYCMWFLSKVRFVAKFGLDAMCEE